MAADADAGSGMADTLPDAPAAPDAPLDAAAPVDIADAAAVAAASDAVDAALPDVPPADAAPQGMALIPAGSFQMGCVPQAFDPVPDQSPAHVVMLDAFYMDINEVTVAKYKVCVDAGACTAPPSGSKLNSYIWGVSGMEQNPVNGVTWKQADAYCKWTDAKGHLPTEAQWEKAARGGLECKSYPWGGPPDCDHAVWAWSPSAGAGCDGSSTMPVGSKPKGKNGYGLQDMAGNVWEWVSDWYDPSYYGNSPSTNPAGPASGSEPVIRGGGYLDAFGWYLSVANRSPAAPTLAFQDVGFRCARTYP